MIHLSSLTVSLELLKKDTKFEVESCGNLVFHDTHLCQIC